MTDHFPKEKPMRGALLDATGTVSIGDAQAVAQATADILAQCFGAGSFDGEVLHGSFALADRLFAGAHPDYLACDMPYHDLRHSLDTALVVARLVAGHQRQHPGRTGALSPDAGLLGVVLGLLHDTGYIRRRSEAAVCSPQLTADHEARSVEFAASWLRTTSLAQHAELAGLILATRLASDPGELLAGRPPWAVALGKMLGAADLLSQMTDPVYLERCYWHLYPELVLAGADRARGPDGEELLLFRDAFDLVRKTPMFYEHVVRKRLDGDFGDVYRHLAVHFGGANPYATALAANVERAASIAAEGRPDRLVREPATTTRDLPPFYRVHAARCAASG